MSKLSLVLAGGIGYVLGARAGQERYVQIKEKATGFWHDPKVQEKKSQAQELVKETAPKVQEKVSEVAGKATAKGKRVADRSDPASDSAFSDALITDSDAGAHG